MNFYLIGKAKFVFNEIKKMALREILLTWDRHEDGRNQEWWDIFLRIRNMRN